jgi:hypothetical protein
MPKPRKTSAGYAMRRFAAFPSDQLVSSDKRAIQLFHRCKFNTDIVIKKEEFRLNSLKNRINPDFHVMVSGRNQDNRTRR